MWDYDGGDMPDIIAGDQHDAESITGELSANGEFGRLYIVTNLERRLVVSRRFFRSFDGN